MDNDAVTDDIANDIRAAFDAQAVETPEPVEIEAAVEQPAPEPEETGEEGRKRGPDGKFLAKETEQAQDNTGPASKDGEEQPSNAVSRVPSSWSPAAKAEFDKLPVPVRQAVAKRELEIEQGLFRKAEELKRYEPLERVIAPHRQKWQVAGIDEATAVNQLLAASDWLEKDPAQAIAYLARQYGVSLQGQAGSPQPSQQAPAQTGQANPEIEQLKAQIVQLKQVVEQGQTAPLVNEVEAFFNDPANLYAENVRDEMALILEAGKATTLKEAYIAACYMRADIRPLLTQSVDRADTAKTMRAKSAAVSVTGSPASASPVASSGSIEDDIRAAMQQVAGRA